MESNCNQMSAMQRNGRCMGNMKCNCSMSTNASMGNSNHFSGCGRNENRVRNSDIRNVQMNNAGCGEKRTVSEHDGRSMEVECVCKVKAEQKCHMDDVMEKLGCRFPVAMAYVPWQQWGELYDAEYGLVQGTIFKDLNKIFCGVRC